MIRGFAVFHFCDIYLKCFLDHTRNHNDEKKVGEFFEIIW